MRLPRWAALAIALVPFGFATLATAETPPAEIPQSVAFLGVHFQNDNEVYEPTNAAEKARLRALEDAFRSKLLVTGRYTFVDVPGEMRAKIDAGQAIGECGGCEIDYGRSLGAQTIAWIRVQKVSNLILNMNVYMADMASQKMTFVRSVDIRGNTDESWSRSLNWLLKNYLIPASRSQS